MSLFDWYNFSLLDLPDWLRRQKYWFSLTKEQKERYLKERECHGHLDVEIERTEPALVIPGYSIHPKGTMVYEITMKCSKCGRTYYRQEVFEEKESTLNKDEKIKPNEYKCYKCGINASKEGYMCTPCAKVTAKQMQDGTYQLRHEENENTKRIVEDLMKEPEIIEKYSFDSTNEGYYQLLDKKIDSEFSGEVEHILFDGRNNNDDLVIAHIEAIQKVKGNYKNGIRDGIFQLFYSKGNLANETSYRKGVKHGTDKMYYVSGQLKQ